MYFKVGDPPGSLEVKYPKVLLPVPWEASKRVQSAVHCESCRAGPQLDI